MSLKDEIEKLIVAEQGRIKTRSTQHKEFHKCQTERFAPLRATLQEIVDSIEPQYIKSNFGEELVTIALGKPTDIRWEIRPNSDITLGAKSEESLFVEKDGFEVLTKTYHYDGQSEDECVLQDELSVSEYIIERITKKIAQYRNSTTSS